MDSHNLAALVPQEFLTWFVCWLLFMALQRKLCRSFPGLRTVCRMIFLWTLVVALLPGVWALVFHSVHGPRLLALCNHAFGLGVMAQTAVRSLLLVRWLAWLGPHHAAPPMPPGAEHYVMATLLALTQVMHGPGMGQARMRKIDPR
jgi:hypothetical protein